MLRPVALNCWCVLVSSGTAGRGQAFDWIGELKRRPLNQSVRFYNFGVGGDLAYNALERLPEVVTCRPDKVVVWIGGNDVLALVSVKMRRFLRLSRNIFPPWPLMRIGPRPDWVVRPRIYSRNDSGARTASRKGRGTRASRRAVLAASPPPIGELDPASAGSLSRAGGASPPGGHPLRIEDYSAIIREVAEEKNCDYLGIHEAMLAQIRISPGRALASFRFLPFYR